MSGKDAWRGMTSSTGHWAQHHPVPAPLKALTVRQPYAEQIIAGTKTVGHRSWRTDHRGRLAIHAGKRVDAEETRRLDYTLPTSVVLGTVEIVGVHQTASGWDWVLANPVRLATPIVLREAGPLQIVPLDVAKQLASVERQRVDRSGH